MIISSATRYIAGRHAVQTVYWRKCPSQNGKVFFKFQKNCYFGARENTNPGEMFAKVQERYAYRKGEQLMQ